MKYYAGIGSRETPIDIQKEMGEIAKALAKLEYILRSGGAEGADSSFDLKTNPARIYLPWNGFNGLYADNIRYIIPPINLEYVNTYHDDGESLSEAAKKLMSRNTYQVLGDDLATPVEFVVCWTLFGKPKGGTKQAMRIAKDLHIPIYNLYNETDKKKLWDKINGNQASNLA